MAALGSHHNLDSATEAAAGLAEDVLGELVPVFGDGVPGSPDLGERSCWSCSPHKIVEDIKVGGRRGPHLARPEVGHVGRAELLTLLAGVGGLVLHPGSRHSCLGGTWPSAMAARGT